MNWFLWKDLLKDIIEKKTFGENFNWIYQNQTRERLKFIRTFLSALLTVC